jgi:hypothetical protein
MISVLEGLPERPVDKQHNSRFTFRVKSKKSFSGRENLKALETAARRNK